MNKPFAIVTGASAGIGLELAAICAQEGYEVDRLWAAAAGRRVDARLANAGHGLGRAFLDQDFTDAVANVTPAGILAEQHRRMAEPGSAKQANE